MELPACLATAKSPKNSAVPPDEKLTDWIVVILPPGAFSPPAKHALVELETPSGFLAPVAKVPNSVWDPVDDMVIL